MASGRAPPPLYAADLELATPAALAAADGAAADGGEPASEWDEAEMDAFFSDDDD